MMAAVSLLDPGKQLRTVPMWPDRVDIVWVEETASQVEEYGAVYSHLSGRNIMHRIIT